jgi:phenylacetate-CoA oxygenase PaaJ subunit
VLLDEPLGALDKQLRERMQYELKQLHERLGKTMVYVTHDQSEALTMSDRIAVFDDGRIQQLAPPTELYEKPTSLFVAEFVGENNRLEGTLIAIESGVARVKLDDGEELRGMAAGTIAPGAKIVASVRPERLVLGGAGRANHLALTVERVVFHGDALRLAGFQAVQTVLRRAPAWTTDWISAQGRAKLKAYGIAPPAHVQQDLHGAVPIRIVRPDTVACPRCDSRDTERLSAFGSTACKALYRCRACREPFEHFKPI